MEPAEYYEGVAAYPAGQCPYAWTDLYQFCYWWAGYHDARRGLA